MESSLGSQETVSPYKLCLALLVKDYLLQASSSGADSLSRKIASEDEDEMEDIDDDVEDENGGQEDHDDDDDGGGGCGGGGGGEDEDDYLLAEEKELKDWLQFPPPQQVPEKTGRRSSPSSISKPHILVHGAKKAAGAGTAFTGRQRINCCVLFIKLIQGVDLSLKDLADRLFSALSDDGLQNGRRSGNLAASRLLVSKWKRGLRKLVLGLDQGGGGSFDDHNSTRSSSGSGLMDLAAELERCVAASGSGGAGSTSFNHHHHQCVILHRASVVGLFFRRLILRFDQLSFSDVTNLQQCLRIYLFKDWGRSNAAKRPPAWSAKPTLNKADKENLEVLLGEPNFGPTRFSRKQAELYIATQVELLQKAEVDAAEPNLIDLTVDQILQSNPCLAEAHFLAYLNCLRVNEFCGAVRNLHKCANKNGVDAFTAAAAAGGMPQDDVTRGFRFAALNLGALHARFHHKEEAVLALKEAIMMAQEANDHVCLQHALSWLLRLKPEERIALTGRFVSKSSEFKLAYLTSLGIQSLVQFASVVGYKPSTVLETLARCDLINCQQPQLQMPQLQGPQQQQQQHQQQQQQQQQQAMMDLITSSYSQKAALWNLYGRSSLSCLVSQLLLHLDTSFSSGGGRTHHVNSEATSIALCNLAMYLNDHGDYRAADQLIALAQSLFPREAPALEGNSSLWRLTQLRMQFQRAIFTSDWAQAEATISATVPYAEYCGGGSDDDSLRHEPCFMKLQLRLQAGDAPAAIQVRQQMANPEVWNKLTPTNRVRLLLFDVMIAGLTKSYISAMSSLMKAKNICEEHNLEFYSAILLMHTAYVQLHMQATERALKMTKQSLPMVLAHGSLYDCCRVRVLLAQCLVADAMQESKVEPPVSAAAESKDLGRNSGRRVGIRRDQIRTALEHLKTAKSGFLRLNALARVKDVLYLMAMLFNLLDLTTERNRAAAEFRKLGENHRDRAGTQLATLF